MLEVLQMFLFLFKSKYRRKSINIWPLFLYISTFTVTASTLVSAKCKDTDCNGNGVCKNETCVCYDGWQGSDCQYCAGKIR